MDNDNTYHQLSKTRKLPNYIVLDLQASHPQNTAMMGPLLWALLWSIQKLPTTVLFPVHCLLYSAPALTGSRWDQVFVYLVTQLMVFPYSSFTTLPLSSYLPLKIQLFRYKQAFTDFLQGSPHQSVNIPFWSIRSNYLLGPIITLNSAETKTNICCILSQQVINKIVPKQP